MSKKEISNEEREQILNQLYLTSGDIYKLLPIGKASAIRIAKEMQEKMKEQKYYIPQTNAFIVNTKFFRKEMKI